MGKMNNCEWRIDLIIKLFPFPDGWPEELRQDYYEWLEINGERLLNDCVTRLGEMILKGKDNGR